MSVLDNIMSGRNLKIKATSCGRPALAGAEKEREIMHREAVRKSSTSLKSGFRKTPVVAALRPAKRVDLGRAAVDRRCCCWTSRWRHERRGKAGHVPFVDVNDEFGTTTWC
jgi:branched-chain amino acid transport system ATP-binding protein